MDEYVECAVGKKFEGKFDAWLRGVEEGLESERIWGSFGGGGLRRRCWMGASFGGGEGLKGGGEW